MVSVRSRYMPSAVMPRPITAGQRGRSGHRRAPQRPLHCRYRIASSPGKGGTHCRSVKDEELWSMGTGDKIKGRLKEPQQGLWQ